MTLEYLLAADEGWLGFLCVGGALILLAGALMPGILRALQWIFFLTTGKVPIWSNEKEVLVGCLGVIIIVAVGASIVWLLSPPRPNREQATLKIREVEIYKWDSLLKRGELKLIVPMGPEDFSNGIPPNLKMTIELSENLKGWKVRQYEGYIDGPSSRSASERRSDVRHKSYYTEDKNKARVDWSGLEPSGRYVFEIVLYPDLKWEERDKARSFIEEQKSIIEKGNEITVVVVGT